jgi:hypothetical protein
MSKYDGFFFDEILAAALEGMPTDQRLKFYDIIVAYGMRGEEPVLTGTDKYLWIMMKDIIDISKEEDE